MSDLKRVPAYVTIGVLTVKSEDTDPFTEYSVSCADINLVGLIKPEAQAVIDLLVERDELKAQLKNAVYTIDRDICESTVADPENESTICISHGDLLAILETTLTTNGGDDAI